MVLESRKNPMGQVKSELWTFRKKRTAVLNENFHVCYFLFPKDLVQVGMLHNLFLQIFFRFRHQSLSIYSALNCSAQKNASQDNSCLV